MKFQLFKHEPNAWQFGDKYYFKLYGTKKLQMIVMPHPSGREMESTTDKDMQHFIYIIFMAKHIGITNE